jgi:hypothetical protein
MKMGIRVFTVNGFRDSRERMKGSAKVKARKESWKSSEDEMIRPEGSCGAQSGKQRRLLARVSTRRRGKSLIE